MKHDIINKIFQNIKIKSEYFEKINIGFTNDIYCINNDFILKFCKDYKNEINFKKEVFLYDIFKEKIPIPKIIYYDNSKKLLNKDFMIYKKISGDNLYEKWHLITINEKKNIIK